MRDTISKHYPNLTGKERFQLTVKAVAEGNEGEQQRLVRTCPNKDYRKNDAAFINRIEATETLILAFSLDLAVDHGKLQLVDVFGKIIPMIVDRLIFKALLFMDKSYIEGFQLGWKAAGGKRKPTYPKDTKDWKFLIDELSPQKEENLMALTEIRTVLQGQVKTLWEAFKEVCREDMGLDPEIPLGAFYPGALEWLKVDLVENIPVNEEIKAKNLAIMREYWQKQTGELTR